MHQRLDYMKAAPDAVQAVYALEKFVATKSGIDPRLLHLLKLRASQINGCAFCVDMHTKEARNDGLSEQWIALVCVWREASVFDARERAVLEWTEALTSVSDTGAPDTAYDAVRAHFSDTEITNLSVAIGTINIWNRLAVGFRTQHPVDIAA
ncbi:carboxymuconolactone decarboxylase family protein [Roseobacter sp. YSTF-M11]|uniref:Carboxymuconolactone decarboxylase family protein n=1 Tax=Roseobacter insulae TaxID=2859783 RepID=A0A9X1FWT2_9RHOB|nr:carboxymuconolactone decarboxylase family protein [Roseobacter insulae]MBW4708737.1 carboxymuconolactone decarboxylase family protein [Roseobacter insulae]